MRKGNEELKQSGEVKVYETVTEMELVQLKTLLNQLDDEGIRELIIYISYLPNSKDMLTLLNCAVEMQQVIEAYKDVYNKD